MLLVTVATENEIRPLSHFFSESGRTKLLVTGVGPVMAAASLSSYLARHGTQIHGVFNIGVGGAYIGGNLEMLDVCLAQQEVFGDFGICMGDAVLDFDPGLSQLTAPLFFNNDMLKHWRNILQKREIVFSEANFVTVSCCSGTKKRGDYLQSRFAAGCENMEGAAVLMVCNTFNIPCVEMRCISNMVEDRNTEKWMLQDAIDKICSVAEVFLQEDVHR